jgi:hypothetical protein
MKHLRQAAVAGFNVLLAEQQKLDVPTRFSLSFFNDEVGCVHDGVPITDIGAMEPADYSPEGNTAAPGRDRLDDRSSSRSRGSFPVSRTRPDRDSDRRHGERQRPVQQARDL